MLVINANDYTRSTTGSVISLENLRDADPPFTTDTMRLDGVVQDCLHLSDAIYIVGDVEVPDELSESGAKISRIEKDSKRHKRILKQAGIDERTVLAGKFDDNRVSFGRAHLREHGHW